MPIDFSFEGPAGSMAMTYPQRLLHEGLLRQALSNPHKTALVIEGRSHSYGELLEAARRLASALQVNGIRRGERVAIYMDNTWPCIVSIFATLFAGGSFLVINPQTKADKLCFILRDCGATVLMTDNHLTSQYIIACQGLPSLRKIIASGKPVTDRKGLPIESFDAVLASFPPLPSLCPRIGTDLATIIYTSGSTGNPKGVMQTHQAMVFTAWSLIEYLRLSAGDRILVMLPFSFDYGLYQLLMSVILGATLIVERSFTFPGQIYQRMRDEDVTVFPGVPTVFATMIAAHGKKPLVFPQVTRVTNTAAALPDGFTPALKEMFPGALIYRMYGLTECKRVSYLEPELLDSKPGSVGKAIPGTEVFLRSPDGSPVPAGQRGILHVRGPHVMAGYWQRPEQTEAMLKPGPTPGERVLCTGDWFVMDEDGFLYFEGRSDDIIKTRSEKVSPVEVENILYGIAGVLQAVVVGQEDPLLGQAVVAFLVMADKNTLSEKDIKKICLARMENYMVPKHVVFLDELPRMANNKVDRMKLVNWSLP